MTNFNIDVVSDAICPWCYLGKKRLERAIEAYKNDIAGGANDTFTIAWHPFYLDPTLPNVGISAKVHLVNKLGPERMAMAHARLTALGEAEGIHFTFNGKIGNTRDSHRLVQLAKTKSNEIENKLVAELFKSQFEEDGDITSHDMLIAAGEKAGLENSEIKDWLENGKGGDAVDREVEKAYRAGVSGVPNFTINGKYEISGAQDVETFIESFVRAKKFFPDVDGASSEGLTC
ncbi:DSBA-like thioredoxin domain-containing protein [Lasiosphaeria ovina]|uniref:DSBA-like thioredoxin domain-containing protein n=1 Tax=Lasiosphaeria ovina TaxID=92902 RepID=A0AAE0KIT1_9PEZI|nr:DSBA-like thioredoxin domain-containing protein [Lasiosphaeria ovina]